MPTAAPLPENAGLAFVGEPPWPPALLTDREAHQLAAAANRCGRPNADVLRRRLAVVRGRPTECWQIDFPEHFTTQEAALYEQPFSCLSTATWQNPKANPDLRRALARISRYLALPVDGPATDWHWIEDDLLPDSSLLVVARDDDFTHGILQSPAFACWHCAHRSTLTSVQLVESFPFPWPPGTALSALSASQEEQRHAVARAARSGDAGQLNSVVLAAYGWSTDLSDNELLAKLTELHRQRTG